MDDICTLKILMFYLQLSYLPVWVQGKFSLYGSFWGGFPMSATKQRNFTKRKMLENLWDGFWYQPYIFQTTNFPFSPVMRGGRPKGTMSPFFYSFFYQGLPSILTQSIWQTKNTFKIWNTFNKLNYFYNKPSLSKLVLSFLYQNLNSICLMVFVFCIDWKINKK